MCGLFCANHTSIEFFFKDAKLISYKVLPWETFQGKDSPKSMPRSDLQTHVPGQCSQHGLPVLGAVVPQPRVHPFSAGCASKAGGEAVSPTA